MKEIIRKLINDCKGGKTNYLEYKDYEIIVHDNNWPEEYHIAVKDTSSDKYIYESHILCKSDVMLYKNIEMIIEYFG